MNSIASLLKKKINYNPWTENVNHYDRKKVALLEIKSGINRKQINIYRYKFNRPFRSIKYASKADN